MSTHLTPVDVSLSPWQDVARPRNRRRVVSRVMRRTVSQVAAARYDLARLILFGVSCFYLGAWLGR